MSLKDTSFNYVKKSCFKYLDLFFPDMYLNVGSG